MNAVQDFTWDIKRKSGFFLTFKVKYYSPLITEVSINI